MQYQGKWLTSVDIRPVDMPACLMQPHTMILDPIQYTLYCTVHNNTLLPCLWLYHFIHILWFICFNRRSSNNMIGNFQFSHVNSFCFYSVYYVIMTSLLQIIVLPKVLSFLCSLALIPCKDISKCWLHTILSYVGWFSAILQI